MLTARARPTTGLVLPAVMLSVIAAVAWSAAWAMDNASYDTVAGILVGIVLAVVALVAGRATAAREPDERIARLLRAAPLLKLAMAVPRFAMSFVLYDGSADSAVYHDQGIRLRASYAEGLFSTDLGQRFVGTGFIRMLTGLLYTLTGPTLLGAYFVFSFVGYWGLYLFYRAFCLAVPEGDRHRYAMLVLLLPSLLFWPSSLGKEAWMVLGLGVLAYGSARVLTSRRPAFLIVLAGVVLAGLVRPHVAAMATIALAGAYLTRRRPTGATITAPIGKLVGILALGVVLLLVAGQAKTLLGVDRFTSESIDDARQTVTERTNQGGSTFDGGTTNFDPSQIHVAATNVLFRPFPWEARNLQSLLAAAEGGFLLALCALGWRRLVGGLRSLLATPYVVLCLTYTVLFIYGFSSFTNFGILTRQRVQVLPFFVVVLCLPPFRPRAAWREVLDAERQTVDA